MSLKNGTYAFGYKMFDQKKDSRMEAVEQPKKLSSTTMMNNKGVEKNV